MFLWIQFFDSCTQFCSVVWIILYLRCGWWCCQNTILYECNIKHNIIYRCIYSKVYLVWICNTTQFCVDVIYNTISYGTTHVINNVFLIFCIWISMMNTISMGVFTSNGTFYYQKKRACHSFKNITCTFIKARYICYQPRQLDHTR